MENPLAKLTLFVIFVFGAAGVLTFFPAAAAPFVSAMWSAIIGLTLLAMAGLILLGIIRYLFFQ